MFPGKATEGCLRAWGKKLVGVEPPAWSHMNQGAALKIQEAEAEISVDADAMEVDEGVESGVTGEDQQALAHTGACRSTNKKDAQKGAKVHGGIHVLPGFFFMFPDTNIK